MTELFAGLILLMVGLFVAAVLIVGTMFLSAGPAALIAYIVSIFKETK